MSTPRSTPLVETSGPTLRQRLASQLRAGRRRLTAPRLTDVFAAVVAVGATLLVGGHLIGSSAAVGLAAGAAMAVAMYLLCSVLPPARLTGGLAVFPAGLALALALDGTVTALSSTAVGAAVVLVTTAAVVAVGLAAPLAATRAPSRGRLYTATKRTGLALGGPLVLLGALVGSDAGLAASAAAVLVGALGSGAGHLLAAPGTYSLVTAPVVVVAVTAASRWALRVVPFDALTPPEHRDTVVASVSTIERVVTGSLGLGLVWLVAMGLFAASVPTARTAELLSVVPPDVRSVVWLLAVPTGIRVALLGVAGAAFGAGLTTRLVHRLRRMDAQWVARTVAPSLGGAVAAGALAWLLSRGDGMAGLDQGLAAIDNPVAALLATFGPYRLSLTLLVVCGAVAFAAFLVCTILTVLVFPDRLTGPALAAFGTFACGLVAATLGATWPALLATVAAVVVWDANTFGRELRDQLPIGPSTARTEFVHVAGSLGAGGVGLVLAFGVAGIVGGIAMPSTVGAMALVCAAGGGLVILAAV